MHISGGSVLVILAVLVFLAVFVWPTPWKYYDGGILIGTQVVPIQARTSRFANRTQVLTIGGWADPTPVPAIPAPAPTMPPMPVPAPTPD